jgi:hypothetical protein
MGDPVTLGGGSSTPVTIHLPAEPPSFATARNDLLQILQAAGAPLPVGTSSGYTPQLVAPAPGSFDPSLVNMLFGAINNALASQGIATGVQTLKLNDSEKAAAQKAIDDAVQNAKDAAAKAAQAAGEQNVTGWLSAIAMLGGALAGTALTAGAGAGALVIAVAVAGTAMAALQVADMGVKDAGIQVTDATGQSKPLGLGIGDLIDAIVAREIETGDIIVTHVENGKTYDQNHALVDDAYRQAHPNAHITDEATLTKIKSGVTEGITIAIAVAMMAVGIGAAGGAMNAGSNAEKAVVVASRLSRVMQVAGNATQIAADVTSGASSIVGGKLNLDVAQANLDKDQSMAQQHLMEATLKKLMQEMNLDQDTISKYMDFVTTNMQRLSASVAGTNAANDQLARVNS